MEVESKQIRRRSNRHGSMRYRFTQQKLPACKPVLTPEWIVTTFVFVAVAFIPIGALSLLASKKVVEIVYRYDEDCVPVKYSSDIVSYIQSSSTNKTCVTTLTVPKKMKNPVFVYYHLDNFYQNHRRYVKSRSNRQLENQDYEQHTTTCAPEARTGVEKSPIVPCGLIAWSLFNDTYSFTVNDKPISINKKNIAWRSDRDHKFGSDVYPKNFQRGELIGGAKLNESIPLSEQEDLIVWMRTAAFPTFRKLYGRIEVDLEAGDLVKVEIENNYNTYSFGGKKCLVMSTTSWIGGKNNFIGIAYIVVGAFCFLSAMGFIVLFNIKPRVVGDPSYLSWNKHPIY